VASPQALERRVAAIEASGYKVLGWVEDDPGHGPAFRFEDPFGHVFELYWETRRFRAGPVRDTRAQEHVQPVSTRPGPARAGSIT
jgi:catechol 2,3-dioxygenase